MKTISFPAYTPEDRDDLGRSPVHARAWLLAWAAIVNAPAGTVENTARTVKVYNGLRKLATRTGDNLALVIAGGDLVLEDAEFDTFKTALTKFRENVFGGQADALMWLDEAMTRASIALVN